jgi:hypothetical protein
MKPNPPRGLPSDDNGAEYPTLEDTFSLTGYKAFQEGNAKDNGEDFKKVLDRILNNEIKAGLEEAAVDKEKLRKLYELLTEFAGKIKSLIDGYAE